jgi:Pal1 cell morphology protein
MEAVTRYHSHDTARRVHPDAIDRLDDVSKLQYHHEGPYDAACAERNNCSQSSPVAALHESNAEILKATPPYKIDDCLHRHRPLDGVAFYPPGVTDPEGNDYDYSEGFNMMTEPDMNFMWIPRMVGCHAPTLSKLLAPTPDGPDIDNNHGMSQQKFTDADFAHDPFYSGDRVGPLRGIRSLLSKAISLHVGNRLRKATVASE